jgi:hypothetical protein
VANHSGVPGGNCSPLGWNQAENPGGAVPPLAFVQLRRAMEPGNFFPDFLSLNGRKTPPGIPEKSSLAMQRIRRQRFSRLCVLMNPILPGLRSIRTWPAKCFNQNLLRTGLFRGAQEVNLRVLVRANRPETCSVDEPAHADIHRRAERQERKQH